MLFELPKGSQKEVEDFRLLVDLKLSEIAKTRNKIKEEFIRTWLAHNVPDDYLNSEIFNDIVLVERQVAGGIRFYVDFKDPAERKGTWNK